MYLICKFRTWTPLRICEITSSNYQKQTELNFFIIYEAFKKYQKNKMNFQKMILKILCDQYFSTATSQRFLFKILLKRHFLLTWCARKKLSFERIPISSRNFFSEEENHTQPPRWAFIHGPLCVNVELNSPGTIVPSGDIFQLSYNVKFRALCLGS